MYKFLNNLGGVVGGFSLILVSVPEWASSLEPLLDGAGFITVGVFSVALIVNGVRSLLNKA
ncbi:hypothetical protein [Paenibacillus spongiae]|uniref:Holin n=1 Tax=Paenibacillus spongiae TaxID=2909671 RepID=A0ABY5S5V4_9BACL|nr:hypothetical protein [Paenibacillus spongiae]UVI29287.1 hypothetical protein L1F29_28290 [Paenibacillus spongiae]